MNNVVSIKADEKVYFLCSNGNKNIIQASKNKRELTKVMEDLNKIAKQYHGFIEDRFYLLEQWTVNIKVALKKCRSRFIQNYY